MQSSVSVDTPPCYPIAVYLLNALYRKVTI